MKTNINIKILPVIIVGVAVLSASFLGFSMHNQKTSLEQNALKDVQATQKAFYRLIEADVKMFKLAITDFSTNQEYKNIFLQGDREKLFKYGQDLFAKHQEMGATHFYFIRKDGTVLSRLHNAGTYDDKVNRATFKESERVNSWGTGIELGKTAFALRVVHPYLNNNEVIGYVELGEEIDHFLSTLKQQTGHEYSIIVEKKYIDGKSWASTRSLKGLRDNYNDLAKYLIIDTTMADKPKLLDSSFHMEKGAMHGGEEEGGGHGHDDDDDHEDMGIVSDTGQVFHRFELGDKSYISGGFSLYDAAGRNVGIVTVTQDVTTSVDAAKKSNVNAMLLAVFATIFICLVMVFLIRSIVIKPLNQVVEAATRVVGGDFNATAGVHSKDEIGELSEMLHMLSQVIGNTGVELEDAYRKLDIAEKLRKSSEEKLNLVKQRIQQRVMKNNKE